jgi:hypothetical protein
MIGQREKDLSFVHNVQNATLFILPLPIELYPFDQLLVIKYRHKICQGALATGPEVSYNFCNFLQNRRTSLRAGRLF